MFAYTSTHSPMPRQVHVHVCTVCKVKRGDPNKQVILVWSFSSLCHFKSLGLSNLTILWVYSYLYAVCTSISVRLCLFKYYSVTYLIMHEEFSTVWVNFTDLTVQTYLFARSGGDSDTGQRNVVSFKKTHYSHTLVASFHCKSKLTDSALQVCTVHMYCMCTVP